jgi:hypothetical protein
MKRLLLLTVVLALCLSLAGGRALGDDFYVISGGGMGKVLKTQIFTSFSSNSTLGTSAWAKLSSPQWTYTKTSSTSYLIITYQDTLNRVGASDSISLYQLRVNDQPSAVGPHGAFLQCISGVTAAHGATGLWDGLPQGDLNLSVWHRQQGCTDCWQNSGVNTTNVMVMEIAK